MRRAAAVLLICLAISVVAALPTALFAATQVALTLNFFNTVVDEQTNNGCTKPGLIGSAYLSGDNTADPSGFGPTSAYTVAPWTAYNTGLTSTAYVSGADCNPSSGNCLAVDLNHNLTVLSMDSRLSRDPTTGKPRALRLDFSRPCLDCAYGPGPSNPFGTNPLSVPGLLSVFLTTSYTSMGICSSTDCPEAETGTARFWFNDASGNQWRVDWGFVRVLRISTNTWYVLADGCDGSQVATLYRLQGKKNSRQGQYLMPFFASAVR